ncbi:MAG: lipopolysaccharide biosynthesis protein [bacterium]|nr:lipopolysaccharide biosynthesis protein [bacterium]
MEHEGVLGKAINAGKWSAFGMAAQKGMSLISFFILARILVPEDYGVITIVLMLVGVLDTLSTPGFEQALIQKKEDIVKYLDVLWTFNLFRACIIFSAIFFGAPIIAHFFNITDPIALSVLRWSGAITIIQALSNMGNIFFFKALDFKTLFYRDTGGQIAFSLVAIGWALWSPTAFALLFGYIAQNIISTILQYYFHAYRPRFSFAFRRLHDLGSYGMWAMGQNILKQANSIVETVTVGRFLGTNDLGLYSHASSIASLPSSMLLSIVYKVGFPVYAKIQDATEKITNGFLKSFDIMLAVTAPFVVLILIEGDRIIQILLGNQWMSMATAMKILVIAFTLKGFSYITYPLFEGVGKIDVRFKVSLLQIILATPLVIIGAQRYGIEGAALAILISTSIIFLITTWLSSRYLKLGFKDIQYSIGIVVGALCAMGIVAAPFYFFIQSTHTLYFTFLMSLLILTYSGFVMLIGSRFNTGAYQTFKLIFKTLI